MRAENVCRHYERRLKKTHTHTRALPEGQLRGINMSLNVLGIFAKRAFINGNHWFRL